MFRERWLEDWWWKTIDDDRALPRVQQVLARKEHPFAETASACIEGSTTIRGSSAFIDLGTTEAATRGSCALDRRLAATGEGYQVEDLRRDRSRTCSSGILNTGR
jgi:hypothetical protein